MNLIRTLTIITAIFLCCSYPVPARADKQNAVLVRNKKGHHHKTPSSQIITCTYEEDYLSIDFTIEEGICRVVVSEPLIDFEFVRFFDSSALTASFEIGEHKVIDVIIETQLGNEYNVTLTQY